MRSMIPVGSLNMRTVPIAAPLLSRRFAVATTASGGAIGTQPASANTSRLERNMGFSLKQ
jgi:hypothetical protein